MIRMNNIKAPLNFSSDWLLRECARQLGVNNTDITAVTLLRKSLDARRKGSLHYVLSIAAAVEDEAAVLQRCKNNGSVQPYTPYTPLPIPARTFPHSPVIVGSGPAGLFAALTLARSGARPLLLERGSNVEERKAAVDHFWSGGPLDPENNVQFGEGGAGTFSDGKLTTGTKDPRIREVLHQLHHHGAPEEILYEAKPHIGTDLLCGVVKNLRQEIIALGGSVQFHAKFIDYHIKDGRISHVVYTQNGQTCTVPTNHLILATGHSARDVFHLLHSKHVMLEQKAFSVGVRIEHPQSEIDAAMYGEASGSLPAADYKLAVHLNNGRSAYTFCMCPGGFVVAGASEPQSIVTNGMSLHARDSQNANSALLVGVGPGDFGSDHPLAGMEFQREIERKAFARSGSYAAPCSTVGDFLAGVHPADLGQMTPSYKPGVIPLLPDEYLPSFVCEALREGLVCMGRKIAGFDAPHALLTGPETRSSSPVRMLRDTDGCSINTPGLYPCGEGAGYAGGIVSAAVDGIRTAQHILNS